MVGISVYALTLERRLNSIDRAIRAAVFPNDTLRLKQERETIAEQLKTHLDAAKNQKG